MKTLFVFGFLALIVWNLGAALYYMVRDEADSKRMVNALTRRVALSIALILLLAGGIATGLEQPHGV